MEDYNPYRKCCEQTMSLWDRFALTDENEEEDDKRIYVGVDALDGKCPAKFIRYKKTEPVDLAEELLTFFNKTEDNT